MAWKKYGKNDPKADLVAAAGEFIGTFLFLFFGLAGIQAARDASAPNLDAAFLLMAATSMAMALVFSVWIFFRVTGAAFNPNISFALMILGVISPLRFVLYVFAQLLGGIVASAAVWGLLPGPMLVETTPAVGVSIAQALFIEMFLTFGLTMTVIMTLVEKNKTTVLAPLAIGLALFSTQLAGIQYTGASVNTARAFGPSVINGHFTGVHWVYWLGPTMGAALAALLYKGLLFVHYWELNPGADATHPDEAEHQSENPSRGHEKGQPAGGLTGHNDGNANQHNTHNSNNNNYNANQGSTGRNSTSTNTTLGGNAYGTAPSSGYNNNSSRAPVGNSAVGNQNTGAVMHPTGHTAV